MTNSSLTAPSIGKLIRARFDNVFTEKLGCALGGFVRQDGGVKLA